MIRPAVTLAFEDQKDIDHWKMGSTHFLDAKSFKSGKLFEVRSFFYMLDYSAYLRYESEIIDRLQGEDAPSHPPIVIFGATAPLYQHPCLHDNNDMDSDEASKLFRSWLSHARLSHHFDYDKM